MQQAFYEPDDAPPGDGDAVVPLMPTTLHAADAGAAASGEIVEPGVGSHSFADAVADTVSILVVSYNTREMILACLGSIYYQTTSGRFEVIVVDNASRDGSADAIEKDYPQVQLIRSTETLGFAVANNLAVQTAKGNFLLLLNPDTLVLNRAIDRLMAFAAEQPEVLIWGGRTLFGDGSLSPASCWRFMSLFALATGLSALWRDSGLFNPEGYGGWCRDTVREVDMVTGCLLLIRRDVWEEFGGFDESFFMYGEEAICATGRERWAFVRW